MRGVLLFLLAACLATGAAFAEEGGPAASGWIDAEPNAWDSVVPPVFSHLTPADGLPYPVALGLAQDGKGFIWAATPGGVARWDGYQMTVFRHDDKDANSLPENIVTAALTDEQGRLWLSTASGVVVRYDEAIQGFVAYRDRGSSFGRPRGMAGDGKGGIWIASQLGLARLDVAAQSWRHEAGIPAGEAGSVMIDRSGRVWAGTVAGLMRRPGDDRPFEPVATPAEMEGDMVSALFEDGGGTIWFGTRRGRVGRIKADGDRATLEPSLPPSGHRVTAFAELRPGMLWIGEYGGGIRELRGGSGAVRRFSHDPADSNSLGDNSVTGFLIDRSGLVWVSSLHGIHRHIPSNQRIMTVIPHGPDGLLGPDVRSVAATADGKVWLGFRAEGLALMDPMANVIKTVPPGRRLTDLPEGTIQAIADTADGDLWAAQLDGLFQVDTATGRTVPYVPLAGANILALRHDGADLWAGGSMGLARIPLDGARPRFYRSDRENPESLSDNSVQAVFRDHAQRLWLGTQRGLNLLVDPEAGRFRRIFSDPDDPGGLPSDIVNSIAEDQSGRLWLATANGIAVFDPRQTGKPRFIRLGTAQGLPSATILSVVKDVDGRIIAGTGGGLSVIDPETLAVRTFGPAEGLHVGTFWAGAATRMSDGTVILGGFGGMAVVRPAVLPRWDYRPPVVVTEIQVGSRTIPLPEELLVHPEDGGFQVDFSALDFSAPERNRYAYRLEGNDGDWIATDAHHRTARYTNLPPGRYRLEIRGSNSVGDWSDRTLTLPVRVLPDWYQTAWFRLLTALVVIAALVGIAQARKAYYLRRERELTRQVAAMTAEAEAAKQRALAGEEDARQAKEAAEAADQMKSRFLAVIGHEIRTPLNGLLGMLQVLDPRALEKGPRELLATAKEAGETLRHLVESVFEYGREGAWNTKVTPHDVDLRRLATATLELMRPQAEAKGLPLTLKLEPEGPVWIRCDHAKLSRILINLVANAIKFTEQGSVTVDIAVATVDGEDRLSLKVADTGIGVAPEMRDAIFGDFVQADDSITRRFGGAGLGLAISRRMAAQMGGALTVDDTTVDAGSTFLLDIPVEAGTAVAAPVIEAPGPSGPSLRVLVVDDDAINRQVAERLLTSLGHRSDAVAGGAVALAALAVADFDVILMDLRMPGMDGMEAARRIRLWEEGRRTKVRIVAMTADLTDQIWEQCEAAGMESGVPKPVQLEDLRKALGATEDPNLPAFLRKGLLDVEFLTMQLDILGPEEMIRLGRLFQRTARQIIRSMDAAVKAGDRAAVKAQAHQLRSAAGSLCLLDVTSKAARLQAEAPLAELPQLQAQVALLREACRTGLKALGSMSRTITSGHSGSMATPNL